MKLVRTPNLGCGTACGLLEGAPHKAWDSSPVVMRRGPNAFLVIGLAFLDCGAAVGRFAADERPSRRRLVSDAVDEGLWPHGFQSREAPDWVNRALGLSLRSAALLWSVMTSLRDRRLSCAIQTTVASAARPQLPCGESRTDESIKLKKPCMFRRTNDSEQRANRRRGPSWRFPRRSKILNGFGHGAPARFPSHC